MAVYTCPANPETPAPLTKTHETVELIFTSSFTRLAAMEQREMRDRFKNTDVSDKPQACGWRQKRVAATL